VKRSTRDAEFTAFVEARHRQLRRIAYAVSGDPQRADDLLQVALTKLYVAWPRVRRDGREEAYARRVIVNADVDERRRSFRRREVPGLDDLDPAADPGLAAEDRSQLVDALHRLPAMQRRTVLLRHWLGLSVEETAAELGISAGTVKSHTSRALARLQELMVEQDA
jgi:RNA polymerase sigma-70 factor (sigma-E family)